MKLGINQLALLRRCLLRGHIGIPDVGIYYHLKDSRKRLAILEKLEIQGYLTVVDERRWALTDHGKKILEENLLQLRGQRGMAK